jgi:hypothetical protein
MKSVGLCAKCRRRPGARRDELFFRNRLTYIYVFVATAVVFMVLGYILGRRIDELKRLSTMRSGAETSSRLSRLILAVDRRGNSHSGYSDTSPNRRGLVMPP